MAERRKRSAPGGEIPIDRFREAGRKAVDWIGDYLEKTRDYPVLPDCREGDLIADLPEGMPEEAESLATIEEDFRKLIVPRVTHWNHPRFFAYFSITGSAPGILGELYTAALNTNGMKWITSPASAELEKVTAGWLRGALGLPDSFYGMIADLASTGTLLSLAVARDSATGFAARNDGLGKWADKLVLYTSIESHVSVDKAAVMLGLGLQSVRRIKTDDQFRMDCEALRSEIAKDRAGGRLPFAVVATAGTTATTSVDPISAIADVALEEKLWLHVDAAYAGPAAMLEEKRPLFQGWERADSLVVNPHKWLFTPIDASLLYFRSPEKYRHAFSSIPEYLATDEGADDPMNYGFQLGRRFRSLKLWFVFRTYGRRVMAERIRFHIELAAKLADRIDREPGWERMAPVPFSTVCFRYKGSRSDQEADRLNRSFLEEINRSGEAYLSHTVIRGRFTIRLTLGNLRTTREDVDQVWKSLRNAARRS